MVLEGRHFRNASDKAMCLVKTRVHIKLLQAGEMQLWTILTDPLWYITCGSLWETNKWRGWESTWQSFFFFFRKKATVLLCTDFAAQGLDFPAIHWVVQLDCSEDANTYSHGRTARYKEDEKTLLFLIPSEKVGILEALQTKKIDSNPGQSQENCLNSDSVGYVFFCFFLFFVLFFFVSFFYPDQEIKHWAQCSFICYLWSIHLQSNKN